MTYQFKCNNCGKKFEISMPLSEYTPNGHYCDECNEELVRDITDFAGGTIWKCAGAFGKSN